VYQAAGLLTDRIERARATSLVAKVHEHADEYELVDDPRGE